MTNDKCKKLMTPLQKYIKLEKYMLDTHHKWKKE